MHFQFDYFCSVATGDIIQFGVVQYIIKHLFYETADLYYFETRQMTSQAQSKFTENTRLRLVFSTQNLTRLVTSFLWFQNSIDQAVS